MIVPNISKLTVKDLKDVSETISEMKRLAIQYKDDVKHLAKMNLLQFYHFLKYKVPYRKDPDNVELVQRPAITLIKGGDCDDKVVVALAYFILNGIKYRIAIADYGRGFEHTYAEIYLPNRGWVAFDTSCMVCDFGAEKSFKNKKVYY